MLHTHHLDSATHSDFLRQQRVDPITGEKIEEGHKIVICAACKSAFFIESWEYLGNEHCNQQNTLSEIPINKSLQLVAKPLEYLPFLFRKRGFLEKINVWSFVLVGFILLICICILGGLIGKNTHGLLGLLFVICLSSFFALIPKLYHDKQVFKIKPNLKNCIYLALDSKKQSITIRKKQKFEEINFDDIIEIRYSLDYVNYQVIGEHFQYTLSIEIRTRKKEIKEIYTVIHKDQIPHWSKFLEDLPYNLVVLNQK